MLFVHVFAVNQKNILAKFPSMILLKALHCASGSSSNIDWMELGEQTINREFAPIRNVKTDAYNIAFTFKFDSLLFCFFYMLLHSNFDFLKS